MVAIAVKDYQVLRVNLLDVLLGKNIRRTRAMSKRAEDAALKAYPPKFTSPKRYAKRVQSEKVDTHVTIRRFYQEGYEQAEKDTIERIRKQVKQWMPEKDGEEHTYGERLAFNSVLHLLEEMEEE
jgi:pyruvate/2-oxoacid:ferredoxin oxidoreductase alpha subunit